MLLSLPFFKISSLRSFSTVSRTPVSGALGSKTNEIFRSFHRPLWFLGPFWWKHWRIYPSSIWRLGNKLGVPSHGTNLRMFLLTAKTIRKIWLCSASLHFRQILIDLVACWKNQTNDFQVTLDTRNLRIRQYNVDLNVPRNDPLYLFSLWFARVATPIRGEQKTSEKKRQTSFQQFRTKH